MEDSKEYHFDDNSAYDINIPQEKFSLRVRGKNAKIKGVKNAIYFHKSRDIIKTSLPLDKLSITLKNPFFICVDGKYFAGRISIEGKTQYKIKSVSENLEVTIPFKESKLIDTYLGSLS